MGNFNVYKSSAGSGKTFLLVKEYLLLCFKNSSPFHFSRILAITFTNKAANEMKSRIIENLRGIAEGNQKVEMMKQLILNETGLSNLELQNKAELILKSILHNYADFNVSTIDRFTHKLIRTFTKDLDLPYNFKVELNQKDLIREVAQEIIAKTGKDASITSALLEQVTYLIDEGKPWNPEKDLNDLTLTILDEDGHNKIQKLKDFSVEDVNRIQKTFDEKNAQFIDELKQISNAFSELIEKNNVDETYFFQKGNGLPGFFRNISNVYDLKKFVGLPNSYAVKSIEESFASKSSKFKDQLEALRPEIEPLYDRAIHLLETERANYISRIFLKKKLNLLILFKEIDATYNKIKSENKVLPIADFNKKISEVVLHEPLPFIYERLGEKYDHILVDEFQDTSVLQFMNLVPIIEESLSRGNYNLIVGDAKQAIYRFRGGDIEQFAAMPNHVPESFASNDLVVNRLQNLKMHYKEHNLLKNYRSCENIVRFNNAFFDHLKSYLPEKFRNYFQGHQQEVSKIGTGGYVELTFLKNEEDDYSDKLYESILDCLNDGYNYKDMTILCRTNAELVKFAEYLSKKEIPIVSAESLLLKNSPIVQFIIDFIYWLLYPERESSILGILNFYMPPKKACNQHDYLTNLFSNKNQIERLLIEKGLSTSIDQLRSSSIYELAETCIREFGLNKVYNAFVQFFLEYVYDFQQNDSASIASFLDWWEEKKDKLAIESNDFSNAIQLMTIHKSKGLEFDVVFYPLYESNSRSSGKEIWVDASHHDSKLTTARVGLNKFLAYSSLKADYFEELAKEYLDFANTQYVAFTRAAERLYLFANEIPKSSGESNSLYLNKILAKFNDTDLEKKEMGYSYGQKTIKQNQEENIDTHEGISLSLPSSSWKEKLQLRLQSTKWTGEENRDAQQYGSLFHEIMAKLDVRKDIEEQLKHYYLKGEVQEEEWNKLKNDVFSVLTDSACKQFFNPKDKVKKEAALISNDKKVLRPDRIVFKENEVLVLDYKTGAEDKKHHLQLAEYQKLIQEIEKKKVTAFLYYLDQKKLIEVLAN